jgi:3-deoxy-D-manno-octulosonate 8-phosphate phosphatase KdsC-like HAD superfamily phosphatase
LLSKAVAARYRTAEAMQTLSRAVDGVTVLEGERGEADEFADLLLELTPA